MNRLPEGEAGAESFEMESVSHDYEISSRPHDFGRLCPEGEVSFFRHSAAFSGLPHAS
jgi:hypothetical protein